MRKQLKAMSAAAGVALVVAGCGSSSKAVTQAPSAKAASATANAPPPPTSAECVKNFGVACYSPKQLQRAYDLAPLYAKGFDGKSRTIVIIDPYGSPTLAKDLATFDRALGLPAPPSLRVVQPVGKVPVFNPSNAAMVDKAGETTGDVETAHEIAPGASILVIETPVDETQSGGGLSQFMAAENYVVTHNLGDVISQSFGLPDQSVKPTPAEPAARLRQCRRTSRHRPRRVQRPWRHRPESGRNGALRPSDRRLAGVRPARHRSRRHDIAPRRSWQPHVVGHSLERQP